MNELLQPGQLVQSRSGNPCKVIKFLGGGAQGEVYKAEWCGGEYALKWYYDNSASTDQRAALETLISEGKPSEKFLWPENLAEASGVPGFGYIMRLRPPQYKSLNDFVAGKIQPTFLSADRGWAGVYPSVPTPPPQGTLLSRHLFRKRLPRS